MKLMIASDLHGSDYWCARMLEAFETEQPERLIFLGDILYHGPRNDLPREYAPKQVMPLVCLVTKSPKWCCVSRSTAK